MHSRRRFLSLAAVSGLPGCGALSVVSTASEPLDTYTLSPLRAEPSRTGGTGHLVVELPTSGGELATDRILIKVSPRQAEYLPGARWSEPAPAMLQTLLVNALLDQGGFRLVSRVGAGLMPDFTLMTEFLSFQAELYGVASASARVHVSAQLTLIRESDRGIAGTRRFESTAATNSDATADLVAGLDDAVQRVLGDAVVWVREAT
ncbi:membrane integrity-associated transporter subunit PqiC [Rhodobacter sp. NTK016B]|uniref:ABC-type transport auxiliary lipoprotein family protein n=1 Tax=Rhodobacter sp. NTK016B TaxID=2759676 RepID=UPI001A8D7551|nr:ABC-type transport auxiliary lipoprotein family protein [Rhodobacter sp. NTK016B]MBN8291292.1 membrane integrity-associated transporter subunit PqiC [Rhodobacter sp. NTK016B]